MNWRLQTYYTSQKEIFSADYEHVASYFENVCSCFRHLDIFYEH